MLDLGTRDFRMVLRCYFPLKIQYWHTLYTFIVIIVFIIKNTLMIIFIESLESDFTYLLQNIGNIIMTVLSTIFTLSTIISKMQYSSACN